ncbi:MAG: hypothetical protein QOH57_4059 [Mycobacterium sp.]|jgi:hypothetical protein|nr:hypothetical protein [Mycobacterium sp.]
MFARTWSAVLRLRVTLAYAATLVTIASTLVLLGPQVQDNVIRHMSTNLHNLGQGHIGTLIGSAFVTTNGPIWVWLPGLMCLLALAELFWRGGRVVWTFTVGHIGATLVVAVAMVAAVDFGWLPISVARASDVGISYGAAAILGALTAAVPVRWRAAWIGWWLSVGLLVACVAAEFTDAGHVVALGLGMVLSLRFKGLVQWTGVRVGLFVVGVAFGYMVLVNAGPSVVMGPIVGTVGALAVHWGARRWRAGRRHPAVPVPVAVSV